MTKERVRDFIIRNFLFGDDSGLHDNTSFLGSQIIDSTGILELVGFLEQEFSVTIEDEELIPDNLDSLNVIESYLERKLGVAPLPFAPVPEPLGA